jgi:hypothetical protein
MRSKYERFSGQAIFAMYLSLISVYDKVAGSGGETRQQVKAAGSGYRFRQQVQETDSRRRFRQQFSKQVQAAGSGNRSRQQT